MDEADRQAHWDRAYREKGEAGVSWFEARPEVSLELIRETGMGANSRLIDIGGGASRLVDALLEAGWRWPTVLDVSPAALETARARLGEAAERVEWIAADITKWSPARTYDIWHDRAVFHFLTDPADRAAYRQAMNAALHPSGFAVIGTFAADGPERCSGLPVMRYDAAALAEAAAPGFELVAERRHVHRTPWDSEQTFQFVVLRKP
jgi:SAM-dependent methyltransferase